MTAHFSCKTLVAGTLALLLGCEGAARESAQAAKLNESCSRNSDCAEPLVCAFERCIEQCRADRDCTEGVCVGSGIEGLRVCGMRKDASANAFDGGAVTDGGAVSDRGAATDRGVVYDGGGVSRTDPEAGLCPALVDPEAALDAGARWCSSGSTPADADCSLPLLSVTGEVMTTSATTVFEGEVLNTPDFDPVQQLTVEIYDGPDWSGQCIDVANGFRFEVALMPAQSKTVELHAFAGDCDQSPILDFVLRVNDTFITEPAFPEDPLNVSKLFVVTRH
jgi:hypothetical protein